jgi:hypothetical protein
MVWKAADDRNGWWGKGVWWWLHWSGNICGMFWYEGETVSLDFFFFTMTWYRDFTLCYEYPMSLQREWKDGHTKIRQRGIRGSKDKGNEGNGYMLGTCTGLSLLSRAGPSCIMSFMLVFFSWMPIWSQPCHLACHYWVYAGPDLVCSSSSYLPSRQHLLLDLSPFRYL